MASATLTAVTTTSSSLSSAAGQHLHHSAAGNPSSSLAAGRSRLRKTSAFSGIATASTPNLNALYSSHATLGPSNANGFASSNGGSSRLLAPPSLSRKQSLAALTPGSLAAIPDASETYALNTVLLNEPPAVAAGGTTTRTTATTGGTRGLRSFASTSNLRMAPLTPGRPPMMKAAGAAGLEASPEPSLAVGDTVDVPGAMYGTVRYIGSVAGRKGTFVGVELNPEFASMGKNNGDVDG